MPLLCLLSILTVGATASAQSAGRRHRHAPALEGFSHRLAIGGDRDTREADLSIQAVSGLFWASGRRNSRYVIVPEVGYALAADRFEADNGVVRKVGHYGMAGVNLAIDPFDYHFMLAFELVTHLVFGGQDGTFQQGFRVGVRLRYFAILGVEVAYLWHSGFGNGQRHSSLQVLQTVQLPYVWP